VSNGRMFVNGELERMWREVVVTYFRILFKCFLGGTEEKYSHGSHFIAHFPACK
jgi:hypothetical protein